MCLNAPVCHFRLHVFAQSVRSFRCSSLKVAIRQFLFCLGSRSSSHSCLRTQYQHWKCETRVCVQPCQSKVMGGIWLGCSRLQHKQRTTSIKPSRLCQSESNTVKVDCNSFGLVQTGIMVNLTAYSCWTMTAEDKWSFPYFPKWSCPVSNLQNNLTWHSQKEFVICPSEDSFMLVIQKYLHLILQFTWCEYYIFPT